MNFSKRSDRFPQLFVDMLDDMITDSTSNNNTELLNDLLALFYARVKDCRQYYKSSVDTCDYYLMEIETRKEQQSLKDVSYDEIVKALNDDTFVTPDYC